MDKKLKVLLVNDDGISSPGIVHLAEMAMQLGEVWVAAPSSQCSAMSQKLTIFQPLWRWRNMIFRCPLPELTASAALRRTA